MAAVLEESIEPDEGTLARWRRDAARFARERLQAARAFMRSDRGPEDYELSDHDIADRVVRIIERRFRPGNSYNNGGGESDLKKWHFVLSALALIGVIMGATWTLSSQISAQSVKIDNILGKQREQDERITRLEQERANRSAR